MPIRIGANPIGWSNDDLQEIGGDIPLETCLAEAREAGFEGMELGHKFPREPQALKAALAPFEEIVFCKMTDTCLPPMKMSWALPSTSTPLAPLGRAICPLVFMPTMSSVS